MLQNLDWCTEVPRDINFLPHQMSKKEQKETKKENRNLSCETTKSVQTLAENVVLM